MHNIKTGYEELGEPAGLLGRLRLITRLCCQEGIASLSMCGDWGVSVCICTCMGKGTGGHEPVGLLGRRGPQPLGLHDRELHFRRVMSPRESSHTSRSPKEVNRLRAPPKEANRFDPSFRAPSGFFISSPLWTGREPRPRRPTGCEPPAPRRTDCSLLQERGRGDRRSSLESGMTQFGQA